jgi:hypothetical protein
LIRVSTNGPATASLMIWNSTFNHNNASSEGLDVYMAASGPVTLANVVFDVFPSPQNFLVIPQARISANSSSPTILCPDGYRFYNNSVSWNDPFGGYSTTSIEMACQSCGYDLYSIKGSNYTNDGLDQSNCTRSEVRGM